MWYLVCHSKENTSIEDVWELRDEQNIWTYRNEVPGEWNELGLHYDKRHKLYYTKLRRMSESAKSTHRKLWNAHTILVRINKGTDDLENLFLDIKILLKWDLQTWHGDVTGFNWFHK
jgi:hypothetical protein